MSVLSTLESVGAELCSDMLRYQYVVCEPKSGAAPPQPALVAQPNPLVSCPTMTRGHLELLRYSLVCYQRQTNANRELVVVAEHNAGDKVRAFITSQEVPNATVFEAPPGLTIGDHRKLAAARAQGAILVTRDDDNLSDPLRLQVAVQILQKTGAAAAFLSRLLL